MMGLETYGNLPGWGHVQAVSWNSIAVDAATARLDLGDHSSALYGTFMLAGERHEVFVSHLRWGARPATIKLDGHEVPGVRLEYQYGQLGATELTARYTLRGPMFDHDRECLVDFIFVARMDE